MRVYPRDINNEFNLLNVNLLVPTGCQFIFCIQRMRAGSTAKGPGGLPPIVKSKYYAEHGMRRCTTKQSTIIAKSVFTGMGVCAALAVCAGVADAQCTQVHFACDNDRTDKLVVDGQR
jgi:hypothetical protein